MARASGSGVRSLLWPGVFTLLAFAALVALGTWQVQRLHWKEGVIARIGARMKAAPVALPKADDWAPLAASDYEYTRVQVAGIFDHAREILLFRPASGVEKQPGFHVYTPLRVDGSAGWIFINRGYVPEALKVQASRTQGQLAGPVMVRGALRAPESRSAFTPADDPEHKLWYTRDPLAMAAAAGLAHAAPFTIDADDTPNPGGWPRGGVTVVTIPNDHLAYALTWYGLALTLLAVFGIFSWRRLSSD